MVAIVGLQRHGIERDFQLATTLGLVPNSSATAVIPPSSSITSLAMPAISQIVIEGASPKYHMLCGDPYHNLWQTVRMANDKNGGPNFLKAWREHLGMTQAQLAENVGTNANMIGYLESGERALTVKWLRRLGDALGIVPSWIMEVRPGEEPSEVIQIWDRIPDQDREQARRVLKTFTQ